MMTGSANQFAPSHFFSFANAICLASHASSPALSNMTRSALQPVQNVCVCGLPGVVQLGTGSVKVQRARLAGGAVAQFVEKGAPQVLGEQHAGVAQHERRPRCG